MSEASASEGPATPPGADEQVSGLLAQVGTRVRKARKTQGISRRVLSERSGVSPRYLAQLEAGSGNISIGLLQRVSTALGHEIGWFFGQEDTVGTSSLQMLEQFRNAEQSVQEEVLRLLNLSTAAPDRAERVCLVGLRGAGKSTLGRMAGDRLDVPFLELNNEIADYGGMAIDEIVALYGQEGYRRLEASALDRVLQNNDRVIMAVAGGIVSEPETYVRLLSSFHTIWLKASPEEHMNRVRAQGDERPMAGNPDAMAQLKSILTGREAQYASAEFHLDTSGARLTDSLDELLELIRNNRFFRGRA